MSPYALDVHQLTKIYPDHGVAVDKLSFQVKQGDSFALLGPNGAGKSTALGMIASLVKKTSGKVLVFGVDSDKDPMGAKRYIGVMPQEVNLDLFETSLEILYRQAGYFGISRSQSLEHVSFLLHEMDLWDKRHTSTLHLSGGMKRRLMVARALVHHPRLLILDEPTAGVDVQLRQTLWNLIRQIQKEENLTLILTTHYLEEAQNTCHRVVFVREGKVHTDSDMDTLLHGAQNHILKLRLKDHLPKEKLSLPFGTLKALHKQNEVTLVLTHSMSLTQVLIELKTHGIEVMAVQGAPLLEDFMLNMKEK